MAHMSGDGDGAGMLLLSSVPCYRVPMLPGLVRVTSVARTLGIAPATVQRWLRAAGVSPVRRPQVRPGSTCTQGPWYVSIEGAVSLVDHILPREIERRANARARVKLKAEARLLATSGRDVRYVEPDSSHGPGGTGSGATTAQSAPTPSPAFFPLPAFSAPRDVASLVAPVPTDAEYEAALAEAVRCGQVLR